MRLSAKFSNLLSMAHHDFCPWANGYVYWLKQPVGWFVIATVASVLVGVFMSPVGWTIAFGLLGILFVGLGFPWIAVRTVQCAITPGFHEVHERQAAHLVLTVRNRLPIPVFGLLVEGYLTHSAKVFDDSDQSFDPDFGLEAIPAWSTATFRLAIRPEYRGRYPAQNPQIACAFPFGIWKARYGLSTVQQVTVWPLIIGSNAEFEVAGSQIAELGSGNRPSSQGDFMGVREFRRGDSLRSIHWAQTARQANLIVCERGGPQRQAIDLHLMTERGSGSFREARENLAWRVRLAATLVDIIVARHTPFRLFVDNELRLISHGHAGRRLAWEVLADIPLDSPRIASKLSSRIGFAKTVGASTVVTVGASHHCIGDLPAHLVRFQVTRASQSVRQSERENSINIDLDHDIRQQINFLLTEASRESRSA